MDLKVRDDATTIEDIKVCVGAMFASCYWIIIQSSDQNYTKHASCLVKGSWVHKLYVIVSMGGTIACEHLWRLVFSYGLYTSVKN